MKLWASISKFGECRILKPGTVPIFDKNPIQEQYPQLERLYIDRLVKHGGLNSKSFAAMKFESRPNRVRGTFHLSGLNVRKLKEFIHARLGNYNHEKMNHELHIFAFTLTYTYLMVCLVKAKRLTEKKVCFSIVVDHRSRLEPPQPANYFGNCVDFIAGEVFVEELIRDDGIIAVVDAVDRTIKSLDDGLLKAAGKWMNFDRIRKGKIINVASSPKLDPYALDFVWGRLRKIVVPPIDMGKTEKNRFSTNR